MSSDKIVNKRVTAGPTHWTMAGLIVLTLFAPMVVFGFEIQQSDGLAVTHDGDVTTVTIHGIQYRLWFVPPGVEHLEIFNAIPEKYRGDFLRAPVGGLVTADEVAKVLEVYYRDVAFDFDSMKLRSIEIPGLRYISICDSFAAQCLRRTVHAGTLVTYEANGKNREGGMTGFEGHQVLITKVAANDAEPTVPGRIVRATAKQLRSELSDGYSAPVEKSLADVLAAARSVLSQAGFTVTADSDGTELFSEPRTMKLTSEQADCGQLYGLSYIGDKRTETTILVAVSGASGSVRVRAAVNGILRVDAPKLLGGGSADKALTCTSTGALERGFADKIHAALE